MRPSEISLDLGTPPGSPTRTSSDFEEIPYPSHHWSASHREEDLPLHYMNEEKPRRRVPRGPGSAVGHKGGETEEYELDDRKDVYAKANATNYGHPLGSGRVRQYVPPPPTSIVCFPSLHYTELKPLFRGNSFSKISNTYRLSYTHFYLVGPVFTRSVIRMLSSGTKLISENSGPTT